MLLEPEIAYDDLIQVMDTIRSVEKPAVAAIGEQDQSRSSTDGEVPGEARPDEGGALHRHRGGRRAMTVSRSSGAGGACGVITGGMLI